MKRILPLLVIAAALIGGAIFLFSGTPQTTDVPDEVAVSERNQVEAAGQLNNVTTRAVDIDDEWLDYRAEKIGAGDYGLNGIVVDENDKPLADIWVAAYSTPYPFFDYELSMSEALANPLSLDLEPLASVMSNEKGEFNLQGIPGRVIYVVARGHKYLTSGRQEVRTSSLTSEEPVIINTMLGAELSGSIIDDSGSPVAGAEVIVLPNLMYAIQAVRTGNIFFERTFADSSGRFKLDAVPAGTRLSVLSLGAPTEPGIKDIGPYSKNASAFENIKLLDTGSMSGFVVDEDGLAVAGAEVLAIPIDLRLLPAVARNIPGWFAMTNASGEYKFSDLPRRGYALFSQSIDGRAAPISATLSGDDTEVASNLVIKSKEKIKGRVVNAEGDPIANARVFLNSIPSLEDEGLRGSIPSASSMLIGMAKEVLPELLPKDIFVNTGSDGRFELSAWEGASVMVIASGYPNSTFDLPTLNSTVSSSHSLHNSTVQEESYLLAMMVPGSIEGKVYDSKSGNPIEFFIVNAELRRHALSNDSVDGATGASWRNTSESAEMDLVVTDNDAMEVPTPPSKYMSILNPGEVPVTPKQTALDKLKTLNLSDSKNGAFRIDNLMPGQWRIKVSSNEYIQQSIDAEVTSKSITKVNAPLSHGATLSGKVVAYGSLDPIQGAIVSMGNRKANGFDAIVKNGLSGANVTASDKDGNFTLRGIKPGMQWLAVTADGFSDTSIKGSPLEEDEVRTGVTIKVRQGATIEGVVYDRHNQILPQRMVGGFSADSEDFWQTTTDENGFYQANNVKPGSYFVITAALSADSLMQGDMLGVLNGGRVLNVLAKEGETVKLDVVDLSAGGCRLKGRLTDKGQPVANAALFCMAGGASMFDLRMASAKTDANGDFEFTSLAPGEYTLQINSDVFTGNLPFEAPDAPEDYQLLETPQGIVKGQIISEGSGLPLSDLNVRLQQEDGPSGMMSMMFSRGSWGVETDENGYYEITGVSPGRYHVVAEQSWWSRNNNQSSVGKKKSASFEVAMHQTVQVETLELPTASSINVTVTTNDGEEFERGFELIAVNQEGDEFESWGWNQEGAIEGLTPGMYSVTIKPRRDYAQQVVEGVVVGLEESVDLKVELKAGTRVSARAVNAGSQFVSATFKVLDSNGDRVDHDSQSRVWGSMENGDTPLGSFEPGTYTVVAEFEGRTQSRSVSLSSGVNQTLEFVF